MLPEGKYLSIDKDRSELVIELGDGRKLQLSTEELDDFIHQLMQCRILMLPPLTEDE